MTMFTAMFVALVFGAFCKRLGLSDDTTMIVLAIIFAGGLAGMKE